ncbi:unnamed protein product, partial [marine sediment metagenome]
DTIVDNIKIIVKENLMENIFEVSKVAIVITIILFSVWHFGLWLIKKYENKI